MKYIDEYRDPEIARALVAKISKRVTKPWVLMEICGGQTHTIMRYGLDELLPPQLELVHGPGCPVCVTPLEMIDKAIALASRSDVILVSYGDMLRVPGSKSDLFRAKAAGGDVRVVYSPTEAVKIAQANPERNVVFFAVGFETTAPANCTAVWQAKELGLTNFSVLVSHVLVPPAIRLLLNQPANRVQGFIAPGHVCAVMGWSEYEPIAARYRVPIVITGFEPVDLLEGILMTVRQLERGRAEVENQYARAVAREGNLPARRMIAQVFDIADRSWRGIGIIPKSGYKLSYAYREHDADRIFQVESIRTREPEICIAGQVLKGQKKPVDCPAFGTECTPQTPLGATMVSAEGACAAYFNYGRHLVSLEAQV